MSPSTLGNTLRDARAKKSLSLDEVHAKIKIHPRVIQLLEEGHFEKLPSPLFAKSFLRSYAEFLGVNADEVLEAYKKEEGVAPKDPNQVLFIKSVDEKKEDDWSQGPWTQILVGIVILAAVTLFLIFIFREAPVLFQKVQASFQKSSQAVPKVAAAATPSKKASTKKALTRTTSGGEVKKSPEWVRSFEQGNFPKVGKKTPLELRLRALDNVWLRVTVDGQIAYQGILGRNAVDTWVAKEGIELWTGNASNMFLSVNRVSLGSPGRGMIRKMVITREGVRISSAENR